MNWCFLMLALVLIPSPSYGGVKEIVAAIKASYVNKENRARMVEEYLKLKYNEADGKKKCHEKMPTFVREQDHVTLDNFDFITTILEGDFNDTEGYRLLLDESTTIDIPAIMQCIPMIKGDNEPMYIDNKQFVLYLVIYEEEGKLNFQKAVISKRIRGDKTLFIIQQMSLLEEYLETYLHNREQTRAISLWFQRAKNKSDEQCNSFLMLLNTSDNNLVFKKGAIIKYEKNKPILYLTETIKINLRGVIVCETTNGAKKYFTISKYDQNDQNVLHEPTFNTIYGPIIMRKTKMKVFAMTNELLEKLK